MSDNMSSGRRHIAGRSKRFSRLMIAGLGLATVVAQLAAIATPAEAARPLSAAITVPAGSIEIQESCWQGKSGQKALLQLFQDGSWQTQESTKLVRSSKCSMKFPLLAKYVWTTPADPGTYKMRELIIKSGSASGGVDNFLAKVTSSTPAPDLGGSTSPSTSGSGTSGGSSLGSGGTSGPISGCRYQGTPLYGSVYFTPYESFADFSVYFTRYESMADLNVYFTQYESFASKCGVWYETKYESFADFTVYVTKYESFADFTVYQTSYESMAGQ